MDIQLLDPTHLFEPPLEFKGHPAFPAWGLLLLGLLIGLALLWWLVGQPPSNSGVTQAGRKEHSR